MKKQKLKFYRQKEGKEEIIEGYPIDLNTAINAVKNLRLSPKEVEIPEMIGFMRERAFIEFTKLTDGYQVRYENPDTNQYLIGELSEKEAIDCLEDFFEGRDMRWESRLERY
ncbi:hypothetical protein [Ferroglobus placidus]|uniref:hypothetical protein n=1 Tax=Ferroglobus placidus TaxID=54261 RepID=UPI00064E3123|nr:hypothetical protein [Ferroglobus placidus]